MSSEAIAELIAQFVLDSLPTMVKRLPEFRFHIFANPPHLGQVIKILLSESITLKLQFSLQYRHYLNDV